MNLLKRLNDSDTVAKFQNYFGIEVLNETNEIHIISQTKNENLNKISGINSKKQNYVIRNKFYYYLFYFGSSLGNEIFYAIFFPFWFWNIDEWVGRRLMIIWVITMYIGQVLKDIIKWERPKSPPVVILESKYALEYGMPSTHAMVGFTLPFSIFLLTNYRYKYPNWIGLIISCFWCILVCTSRLYLGMHSILDLIGGLFLSAIILLPCISLINIIDEFYLKNEYAPFIVFTIILLLLIYYPKSNRWSPSRGDTCIIVSFTYGTLTGSWLNYQLRNFSSLLTLSPSFLIMLPGFKIIFFCLLRSFIGGIIMFLIISKGNVYIYWFICYIKKLNSLDPSTKIKTNVYLPVKFITYTLVGLNVTYICPLIFNFLNIERIKVYTEF